MASYTKIIGDIGVSVVISEFLKHGINILLPYDDNSPYDIVIYVNDNFYKVQVKTTEKVKYDGSQMEFDITKSNPYSKIDPKYVEGEVDYFAVYCIENEWCGLFGFDEYKQKLTFRLKPPLNNQTKNIKFAKDYLFHDQVMKFFNKDYIKNTIVHTEPDKKTYSKNRKMKLCPICNQKEIRLNNNMCRECYDNIMRESYLDKGDVIKLNTNIKNICPICNTNYKSISSEMCNECRKKEKRKDIPEKEELKEMIGKNSFNEIREKYGKPPCTIRRWFKGYDLPYTKEDIDKLLDETN